MQRGVYTDYRGIPVLGAFRRIAGTDWNLVVEQDEQEAFAPARRLRRGILLAIALTLVGASGASLLLAQYVTAPIRTLSAAATGLAAGDFASPAIRPPGRRRDEIGTLHRAFAHMADQLRERQATLESRVGRTEAELQQADVRLQDTIRAAARSEHLAALGRLASSVAHEIRTPLTSLKLYLQTLQEEDALPSELREDSQLALRQVERIHKTVNHFLTFARPADPIRTPVDVATLIEECLLVVRPRAHHQSVAVRVEVAPDLPPLIGDVRQLGEALVNLMVNALDEMPGGGRLEITAVAERAAEGGPQPAGVRIDVSDTGPGVRESDRERIFEPFFTTKASGSGLGLAIVRGTLQRHGGHVRVHSALPGGTTFSLLLPSTPEGNRER